MPTRTHMGTAGTEATLRTGEAAVRSQESSRAVAGSRGRVARTAIETLTNLSTAWPIAARWASLLTVGAVVTGSTYAGP